MEHSNYDRSEVYSTKIRAGKRTYFFDVKSTRSNDYYITITESKRRLNGDGYDKHKIFLYKEDFNKFMGTLKDTIDYVKIELLPDYNYEEFDRESQDESGPNSMAAEESGKYGSRSFQDDDDDGGKTRWDD